jgi:putative FmdB family regulatory protein
MAAALYEPGFRCQAAAIIARWMPIYEYRCRNGHDFEVFQSMTEEPVSRCPECGAPVERVFRPVAVHFKGKGFYTTDYARAGSDGTGPGSGDAKKESGKESGKEKSGKDGSAKKDSGGEKTHAGSGGD